MNQQSLAPLCLSTFDTQSVFYVSFAAEYIKLNNANNITYIRTYTYIIRDVKISWDVTVQVHS